MDKKTTQLERLRSELKDGDREVSNRDRDLLLEFSDELFLLKSEYGDARHKKLLSHLTMIAEGADVDLADTLEDKDTAEDALRWINRSYENQETNRDYRIALRMLGKRTGDSTTIPGSLEWIPATTSRDYNPSPDPSDMLRWEDDIQPMIEECYNRRDEAMIATAWDSGARAGEFLDMTIGDVTDHKHGLRISLDGKNGQRSVTLITAVPYLNRWLSDHPRAQDREAPLWCKLETGDEISYQMALKIPRQAADLAGVDRPVNWTNFRKSSASYLASQGVTQAVLEDHHGWVRGSKAASRYISVFSDASDREIAKAHGIDVEEEEPEPIGPVECDRCGRESPRSEDFCMWCHQALQHGAAADLERKQDEHRRELLGIAQEHPELLERLDEMEPLVEALGGDTDVIDTAREFVDAADD